MKFDQQKRVVSCFRHQHFITLHHKLNNTSKNNNNNKNNITNNNNNYYYNKNNSINKSMRCTNLPGSMHSSISSQMLEVMLNPSAQEHK